MDQQELIDKITSAVMEKLKAQMAQTAGASAPAAGATQRIELGSWVVPFPTRHPAALAQQALTAQAASGGRLLLGVGVSHAEVVEKRMGLAFRAPASQAREYLAVLRGLLAGERVAHEGEWLRVRLRLDTGDTPPPPIFLAALGPLMLRLAGAKNVIVTEVR